jgi:DNA-binding protein Fis
LDCQTPRLILLETDLALLQRTQHLTEQRKIHILGVWYSDMRQSEREQCEKQGIPLLPVDMQEAEQALHQLTCEYVIVQRGQKVAEQLANPLLEKGATLLGEDSFSLLEQVLDKEETEIFPLRVLEQRNIEKALNYFGTSVEGKKRAAISLGISLATLYNKIKQYELSK